MEHVAYNSWLRNGEAELILHFWSASHIVPDVEHPLYKQHKTLCKYHADIRDHIQIYQPSQRTQVSSIPILKFVKRRTQNKLAKDSPPGNLQSLLVEPPPFLGLRQEIRSLPESF